MTPDALYAMACRAKQPGWWEEYRGDLPGWFTIYVELQAAARRISTYQPNAVDGLLQTPDYARALFAVDRPKLPADEVERQLMIRLQRQHYLLTREDPVTLDLVPGEAVLLCTVGGPDVLTAQREHLRVLKQWENIDIQVLTFAAGAHPAINGRLTVVDLDGDADPGVESLPSRRACGSRSASVAMISRPACLS